MKKAVLIINPSSGEEKALSFREKLEKKSKEYFEIVQTRITRKAGDAIHYAKQASKEKCEAIFSLGGDGTINEVISGIAERDYIPNLGIIPCGTGNLVARFLGINQDIDKAIDELDFSSLTPIDIGKCNDKYFGYMFSIGAIPKAIHDVDIEDKTKFGQFAYVLNSLKSIINDTVFPIKIKTEKRGYSGNAGHVLVMLSNYFGDKKIFNPNKDGYANILILKDSKFASKLSLIPDLIKGNIIENDKIEYIRANEIEISSEIDLDTDFDGDKGDKLPAKIKILGQHIQVYTPKQG